MYCSLYLADVWDRHCRAFSRHAYGSCLVRKLSSVFHRQTIDQSSTEPTDPAISGTSRVDAGDFDGWDNLAIDFAAMFA